MTDRNNQVNSIEYSHWVFRMDGLGGIYNSFGQDHILFPLSTAHKYELQYCKTDYWGKLYNILHYSKDLKQGNINIADQRYHKFVGMGMFYIANHRNPNIEGVSIKRMLNHSSTYWLSSCIHIELEVNYIYGHLNSFCIVHFIKTGLMGRMSNCHQIRCIFQIDSNTNMSD